MPRRLVAAVPVLVALAFVSSQATAQSDTRLRARMDSVLREEQLIGAVWATVWPDGSVRSGATGLRDGARALSMTDTTRVHVGSIAKTVLATGVLRLVTEGRVALDDPIAKLLPDVAIKNPWEATDPLTLRHLIDFTSGLDDMRLWQLFTLRADPDRPLSEGISRHGAPLTLRSRPGERMSYSNLGYALAAMVVERVTATRYEQYLDSALLVPLEMTRSTFGFVTQEGPSADPTLAWGHVEDGTTYAALAVALRPAGQFTTTASDLARFAKFLMSDGTVGGREFIRADLMRARGHATTTEASRAGLEAGYALGLFRRDRHGVVGLCHGGSVIGYNAMLCVFPEEQKAYVLSINTDSETARYERVHDLLVRELAVREAVAPPSAPAAADIADWEGVYLPAPNRIASFAYLDALFGQKRVRRNGDELVITGVQGADRILRPVGGYLFASHDRATTSHVLLRGADGRLRFTEGFNTFERRSVVVVVALWASFAVGIAGLLWILLTGTVSLIRAPRRFLARNEVIAFAGVVALAIPAPFLLTQSLLQLGDVTIGNVLVASVTGALPLILSLSVWQCWRGGLTDRWRTAHVVAAAGAIQWCLVLAWWGLLPLRLWA